MIIFRVLLTAEPGQTGNMDTHIFRCLFNLRICHGSIYFHQQVGAAFSSVHADCRTDCFKIRFKRSPSA